MINFDKSFTKNDLNYLSAMKNKNLVAEGHVPINGNVAFGRLRLYFDEGDLDITATMQDIDYTGDGTFDDDEAFLALEAAEGTIESVSEVAGSELRTNFDKTVKRVLIVQDTIDSYENVELTFKMTFPQAIALDLGDEYLCIDKKDGPWAMITVSRGEDLNNLIYDLSEDWENDDETPALHNEFRQEIIEL